MDQAGIEGRGPQATRSLKKKESKQPQFRPQRLPPNPYNHIKSLYSAPTVEAFALWQTLAFGGLVVPSFTSRTDSLLHATAAVPRAATWPQRRGTECAYGQMLMLLRTAGS